MTTDPQGVKTIYVDLDHTLICIDLLRDCLVNLLLSRPYLLPAVAWWILRGGPPRVKAELAARYAVQPENLPYNVEVLAYLQTQKAAGHRLVLASATAREWAETVAAHVNLFDAVLATSPGTGNVKGRRKLEFIQRDAGGEPFGYAGDSTADRPILEAAALPIVVGATADLAGKNRDIAVVLPSHRHAGRPVAASQRWNEIGAARTEPPLRPHQSPLRALLAWNLGATILGFFALEWWRPCYFLTDDNLSGWWPAIMEMGRRLKEGRSPFYSDYLFGGHYDALRDMGYTNWHPLVMGLSLLADTPAQFWIIDLAAFALLLVTAAGFTVLACRLREEFSLAISDGYLVFYVLSFVFCTFILTVGAGWMNFLATQSCLPWFMLGLLESRPVRGTFLIALFTIHEFLLGYPGLLVSVGLCFSIVALVLAVARRSIRPLFCWGAGNLLAVLVLSPLILNVLDGFAQSTRVHGLSLDDLTLFAIPPFMFMSSFFAGNWAEPLVRWMGDSHLASLDFPYLPSILACAAAWCVGPALFSRGRWGYLDKLCFGLSVALVVLILRPHALGLLMQHLPVFRSLRWPFREGLLFLFFVHLFLILRFREGTPRWQGTAAIFGLLVFVLPLPFIRPPSLNPLALDRRLLFSGQAQAFWTNVKATLHPGDQIATVIDDSFWKANARGIPYSLLGTANFPSFFQVCCGSGYSATAPEDQKPIKTWPHFWFGAFDEEQVPKILAERPHLRLFRVVSTHPLKITMSDGAGPQVDLTPALQAAGITEAAPVPPGAH